MTTDQIIAKNIKNSKGQEKVKWMDIQWMASRRTMRNWTIEQLEARWNETTTQHNIELS